MYNAEDCALSGTKPKKTDFFAFSAISAVNVYEV